MWGSMGSVVAGSTGRCAPPTLPTASYPARRVEFRGNMKYVSAERELALSLSALLWLVHMSAGARLNRELHHELKFEE